MCFCSFPDNFDELARQKGNGSSVLVFLVTCLIFSLLVVVIFFVIKLRRAHILWKRGKFKLCWTFYGQHVQYVCCWGVICTKLVSQNLKLLIMSHVFFSFSHSSTSKKSSLEYVKLNLPLDIKLKTCFGCVHRFHVMPFWN